MLGHIDSNRQGDLPLIVPVTLANRYVRKYQQSYLNPHPVHLQLRNHV